MNRVGGQAPVGAGGHAVAERLDEPEVATLEAELDARARERVSLRPLPLDTRLAQEHPESRALVELHRVAPRGEVAAVDRHGSPAPHAIVPFEAYTIGDDHIRLTRIGGGAIVDRRAARGVRLERVPHTLHRPVIGQVGPPQHRAAVAVHRDHVLVRLEPLLAEEVGGRHRVERDGRVADVNGVFLADHVEAPQAREPGYAVGGERASRALAVGQDAAAREHIGLARPHLHLLRLPPHGVDHDLAGPPPGGVGGRGGLLGEGDEEHGGHHWFGRVNLPPSPLTLFAVTTLKSGSAVKPVPLMCRVGSSNTKSRSELTWFRDWLYRMTSVRSVAPSVRTTTTLPRASMSPVRQ